VTSAARSIRQTWVPVGRSKGGQFSNSTAHDSNADTFVVSQDHVIRQNSWVPRPAYEQITDYNSEVNSISIGNFYSGTSPTPTSRVFVSTDNGNVYWNDVAGNTSQVRTGLVGTINHRVVFNQVKNRMFCCNGFDLPFIVSAPNPTLYPSVNAYRWGGVPQGGQLTYTITADTETAGSLTISAATPAIVTGAGTNFLAAGVTEGQPIYINGIRFTIAVITDATHLTLGGGPNGDGSYPGGANTAANGAWQINKGPLFWDAKSKTPGAFTYAVSFYDPITGHTTNVCTPITVSDGPPLDDGVKIVLHNIQTTADLRFTIIIVWRSFHGGAIMFPRAVLHNTGGPLIFTDDDNDDTHLGDPLYVDPGNIAAGGPGVVAAPQVTNGPPPNALNFATFWDGRFWGSDPTQPGLVFFSARNDFSAQELTVGVGEESWPLTYTLPIPDTDGRMTGSRVVGQAIFILTDRGTYQVLGNSWNTYRLSRVTSKGGGANHFASASLPGEDMNSSDILVHLGNDRRLYYLFGPGGDVSYSYPIQDQVDAVYPPWAATEILHNSEGTFLLMCLRTSNVFAFDVERQTWFTWTSSRFSITSMYEGLFNGTLTFFMGGVNSLIRLNAAATPTDNVPALVTQRFNPPGVDRHKEKTLQAAYLYDKSGQTGYTISITTDDGVTLNLVPYALLPPAAVLVEPQELYFPVNAASLGQSRTYTMSVAIPSGQPYQIMAIALLWSVTDDGEGESL